MKRKLTTVAGITLYWDDSVGKGVVSYISGMTINADGINDPPACYGPNDTGMDHTREAGHTGNWWGVVTDNGKKTGTPILQGPNDPAPGMFVSCVRYKFPNMDEKNPRAYPNGRKLPLTTIPMSILRMVPPKFLGCRVLVRNRTKVEDPDGKGLLSGWVPSMVADISGTDHLGEGSPKLAELLLLSSNPKHGGTSDRIIEWKIFPGVEADLGDGVSYPLLKAV